MISLYLLGSKALSSLQSLPAEFNQFIKIIIIGSDNGVKNDFSKEIQKEAIRRKISFSLRRDNSENEVYTNYSIAIGWRWLIPTNRTILIVFHDSVLPRYRGFNPLVTALINGDRTIGVTALFGHGRFDSGDIIDQWTTQIAYPIKIHEAIEKISQGYVLLLNKIIEAITKGDGLSAKSQQEEKVSYSIWRDSDDYRINWNWDAEKIVRFIDAVGYPYEGAQTMVDNGIMVKILEARVWSTRLVENGGVGKVLLKDENDLPVVVCGKGLIQIQSICDVNGMPVQLPGKLRYKFK